MRKLDGLGLVDALVQRDFGAPAGGKVGFVAQGIQVELSEAGPCFSVVIADSGVDSIPVRKNILPQTGPLLLAQVGVVRPVEFGQRRRVAPEEDQSPVLQAKEGGHRDRSVEP